MEIRFLASFERDLSKLHPDIRERFRGKLKLFQQNPEHRSLRIKKMKGWEDIWEGHVTPQYVFTFHWESSESGKRIAVFHRIGTHQIYRSPT
jgi:mRNA-degrading endonuclease RelE of RelBE toxin-antitoxin system